MTARVTAGPPSRQAAGGESGFAILCALTLVRSDRKIPKKTKNVITLFVFQVVASRNKLSIDYFVLIGNTFFCCVDISMSNVDFTMTALVDFLF